MFPNRRNKQGIYIGFIAFAFFLHILVSCGIRSIFAFAKLTFKRMQRHAEPVRRSSSKIGRRKSCQQGSQPSIIPDHPSFRPSKTSRKTIDGRRSKQIGRILTELRTWNCHRFLYVPIISIMSYQDVCCQTNK